MRVEMQPFTHVKHNLNVLRGYQGHVVVCISRWSCHASLRTILRVSLTAVANSSERDYEKYW